MRCRADGADLRRPDVADASCIARRSASLAARPQVLFWGSLEAICLPATSLKGEAEIDRDQVIVVVGSDLRSRVARSVGGCGGGLFAASSGCGAAGVRIDTWAGVLGPEASADGRFLRLPEHLSGNAPRVFYTRDCSPYLPWLKKPVPTYLA